MQNITKFFIAAIVVAVTITSCYYDNEQYLYGISPTCTDTATNISYAQKLVPVFQQNCYGCHTGSFPSGGILMGTYAADKAIATNGKLYGSISHATGFSPMPKGAAMLSACSVSAVKKWIDAGSPNN
jgi:mono/diheme cytochrome c family protein